MYGDKNVDIMSEKMLSDDMVIQLVKDENLIKRKKYEIIHISEITEEEYTGIKSTHMYYYRISYKTKEKTGKVDIVSEKLISDDMVAQLVKDEKLIKRKQYEIIHISEISEEEYTGIKNTHMYYYRIFYKAYEKYQNK